MNISTIKYSYQHVPTIRAFTLSKKRIKCIIGPFGSGKSSGCVMHLLKTAQEQDILPNSKIRPTRYVIVRNTTKELKDTTKKTIDEWIMPLRPRWKESENKYLIEFRLTDGSVVQSEWLLRALDRPEQIKDLLSLEVSGAWLNEAREIPLEVFDILDGRIGRYPKKQKEYNFQCNYPYIILDSNPPDTDNWLYKYFEEKPLLDERLKEKIEIFKQPSGLSPEAENLVNLTANYYQNLAIGKDPDWVRVYIHGEYGYVKEGKPVFPLFSSNYHVAKEPLIPIKSVPLTIGMDFGLYPAAVITQVTPIGSLHVYDELVSEDVSDIEQFVKDKLYPLLNTKYRFFSYIVIGDPAGQARSQLDASRTCFTVLRSYGIKAYPAYTNSLSARIQAVNNYLTRTIKGDPSFKVSPECRVLIKALTSKYCFRRLRLSGERYTEIPEKNEYSHVADALTYACLGYTPKQIIQRIEDDPNFSSKEASVYKSTSGLRPGGWF